MRIDVQTEAISQDLNSKVVHASRNTHETFLSAILLLDFCTVDDERTEVLFLFYFFMLMSNTLKCKGWQDYLLCLSFTIHTQLKALYRHIVE